MTVHLVSGAGMRPLAKRAVLLCLVAGLAPATSRAVDLSPRSAEHVRYSVEAPTQTTCMQTQAFGVQLGSPLSASPVERLGGNVPSGWTLAGSEFVPRQGADPFSRFFAFESATGDAYAVAAVAFFENEDLAKRAAQSISTWYEERMKPLPAQDQERVSAYYNGPMEMMVFADGRKVIVTCELRNRVDRSIRSELGAPASVSLSDPRLSLILNPSASRDAVAWDTPLPRFPAGLPRAGVAETVTVDITVGDDGAVRGVTVYQSSTRPELDRASTRTVWDRWRFLPAMSDGRAVQSKARLAIKFGP